MITAFNGDATDRLREALDALTDAEQYHSRRCAKDQPHDHALLRKLQSAIRRLEPLFPMKTIELERADGNRGLS